LAERSENVSVKDVLRGLRSTGDGSVSQSLDTGLNVQPDKIGH